MLELWKRSCTQVRMRLHPFQGSQIDRFFQVYQIGEDAVRNQMEEGNNVALIQADRFVQSLFRYRSSYNAAISESLSAQVSCCHDQQREAPVGENRDQ